MEVASHTSAAGDVASSALAAAGSSENHAIGAEAAAQIATALKALANPERLRMLSLIATSPNGEACVWDIASVADVAQPTVSHHL